MKMEIDQDSSGADNKVVILNLTLYKVQQGIYLLDFHKVKGELFPVSVVPVLCLEFCLWCQCCVLDSVCVGIYLWPHFNVLISFPFHSTFHCVRL